MKDTLDIILLLIPTCMVAVMFIALAIPLVKRKVKPNSWYGWRTPGAYKSEEIWYDINAYSGRDLIVTGIVLFVSDCLIIGLIWLDYLIDPEFLIYALVNAAIVFIGVIATMVRGFRHLAKISDKNYYQMK